MSISWRDTVLNALAVDVSANSASRSSLFKAWPGSRSDGPGPAVQTTGPGRGTGRSSVEHRRWKLGDISPNPSAIFEGEKLDWFHRMNTPADHRHARFSQHLNSMKTFLSFGVYSLTLALTGCIVVNIGREVPQEEARSDSGQVTGWPPPGLEY
jgi:hypothetical protein